MHPVESRRNEGDLPGRRKGDTFQVRLARRLRRETTLGLKWIAKRLHMGSWTYVSNLLHEERNHETCVNSKDRYRHLPIIIMTRRQALKTATLATAAYATLAPRHAAAAEAPPLAGRIHHSACRWCYRNIALDDLCAAAKRE